MFPVDLSRRIHQPEKMDGDQVTPAEFHRAVRELSVINRYLGGWRTSVEGVRRLLPSSEKSFSLLDVGTGGGDVAAALHRRLSREGHHPLITGVDRSGDSISYARSNYGDQNGLRFRRKNVYDLSDQTYDVVHASLFLHHFSTSEIPRLLRKLFYISRRGVVINDLHRHPIAFHSIKWLTQFLSNSELVRHDAPLSVRRSFKRDDFPAFAETAGLPAPDIRWHWAFRWRVVFADGPVKLDD